MHRLNLVNVRKFNNFKHNILDDNKTNNISIVIDNLIGLHSARLITPYATLIPRVNNFSQDRLTSELFVKHNLIKMRCMRKTLHTVTIELAPIVHQATKDIRLSICKGIYKKIGVSTSKISFIKAIILELLNISEMGSKEIELQLFKRKNIDPVITRSVIKELWEEGSTCYINRSDYWGFENRKYALTKKKYPNLFLEAISVKNAQVKLIFLHIKAYGPVTAKDISWWSGLSISIIKRCLKLLEKKIISVTIKGFNWELYISANHLDEIHNINKIVKNTDSFTLLAYEDPSLKGYYESRERYIRNKFYPSLFNVIGEARASILKNGEVIGIWIWDKKKQTIKTNLFTKIKIHEQKKICELTKQTRLSLLQK